MKSGLRIGLKSIVFLAYWAIFSLGSAVALFEYEFWLFTQWWYYCLLGVWAWLLAFRANEGSGATQGRKGVVNVLDLTHLMLLEEPSEGETLRLATVRQSGNEQSVKLLETKDAALHEIVKTFNRKGVDQIRIWKNTPNHFDARITFHHGKGSNEGKVIRGVDLKRVKI